MKKGISFFFGYKDDKEYRAELIKDAGFDCVITNQDPRFDLQNGTIEEQMELFKKYNLEVSSLHNQYTTSELENFWLDNEIGERLEKTLIFDILTAKKYGIKCVVVHMVGEYNKIGEDRILRVLKVSEENNVALAVENIDHQHPFIDIFENISHPYLKFCYDSGHNNCFDKDFDYLEKYGDKLICLHLHDNDGTADQHTLNRFGNIDWDSIAQRMAKLDLSNVCLDYEALMNVRKDVTITECVKEFYQQAVELENKIEYYKQKQQ